MRYEPYCAFAQQTCLTTNKRIWDSQGSKALLLRHQNLRELGGGTQGLERLEAHRGGTTIKAVERSEQRSTEWVNLYLVRYGYFRKDRGTTHHALLVLYARTQHKMTIIPLLEL